MDDLDIIKGLVAMGVPEQEARDLKGHIDGNDLMALLDGLSDGDPLESRATVQRILGKYGVKLRGEPMKNDYLGAKFESIKSGQALDETFGVMTKLDEQFTYSLQVTENTRDRVLDWLDENQVVYQANSPTSYQVSCENRDQAYRTGRAMSRILGKPTVRDSVEISEGKKKTVNTRVRAAKEKMAAITPKDPNKQSIISRSGSGVHKDGKDPRKVDHQGREAKHKIRHDEQIEDSLNEGVTAMKPLNPLFRLRELAGLPKGAEEQGMEIAPAPTIDPNGILGAGPVDGLGADPVADPMDDMDGGVEPNIDEPMNATDPMGDEGVPGELGADPIEPIMDPMATDAVDDALPMDAMVSQAAPTQSDAMREIEDSLNGIQTMLADIRLSEYKSLIKKLQDLTNQAQMMGRDYLGERRKK